VPDRFLLLELRAILEMASVRSICEKQTELARLDPLREAWLCPVDQRQFDEVVHRDDAAGRWSGKPGLLLGAWLFCVSAGSDIAVRISRKL
jgi:hypothetical protein